MHWKCKMLVIIVLSNIAGTLPWTNRFFSSIFSASSFVFPVIGGWVSWYQFCFLFVGEMFFQKYIAVVFGYRSSGLCFNTEPTDSGLVDTQNIMCESWRPKRRIHAKRAAGSAPKTILIMENIQRFKKGAKSIDIVKACALSTGAKLLSSQLFSQS